MCSRCRDAVPNYLIAHFLTVYALLARQILRESGKRTQCVEGGLG
jgi:hypothetical protein